jgi:putative membrane protein
VTGAADLVDVTVSLVLHALAPAGVATLVDHVGRRVGVLRPPRRVAWWSGMATVTLAVSPPLDALAHVSFLWHMLQHLAIVLVAAPALVLARPDLVALRTAPPRVRRRLARWSVAAVPRHWLGPALALTGFLGWLWLTHLTPIYDRTLSWPVLHVAEHVLYLLTAMAFWVPFVLRTSRSDLVQVLTPLACLLVAMPASSTLAFVLLNADQPRYAAYSLADQRAGAIAMWVGMSAAMLAVGLTAIARAFPSPRQPTT